MDNNILTKCHYYNGEFVYPYEKFKSKKFGLFWMSEAAWVNFDGKANDESKKLINSCGLSDEDFIKAKKEIVVKEVPIDLRAIMFEMYNKCSNSAPGSNSRLFFDVVVSDYINGYIGSI